MNLSAYDKIKLKTDTWINSNSKRLYSYELPVFKHYEFLQKYNKETDEYEFFIACSNNDLGKDAVSITMFGRKKSIKAAKLFSRLDSRFNDCRNHYLNLIIDSNQKDGIIFKINFLEHEI